VPEPPRRQAEIAQPGAQIEDVTLEIFKRQLLERIQFIHSVPDLFLELGLEEFYGIIFHRMRQARARVQIPMRIKPTPAR